jgi:Tfp pilus assembly protein PilV
MSAPSGSDSTRPAARSRRRRRRHDAGFSLLEIMFCLAALLTSVIVLYQSLITGQVASRDHKLRHRALQDANSLTEQMMIIPLPNLSATFAHDTPIPEFDGLHCPDQQVRVLYEAGAGAATPPVNYSVVSTWTSTLGRTETLVVRGVRAR